MRGLLLTAMLTLKIEAKVSFESSAFIKQHGVVSQKTQLLINTAERTSHMGSQFVANRWHSVSYRFADKRLCFPLQRLRPLTFRGDRRDLILMLRLEEQNEEIARLLPPAKSIVTFRRVGCETCSCVQAASALFVELSHPPLQRSMRGQEAYESLRELAFGISQKGNSRSGQQLLSVNVVLSFLIVLTYLLHGAESFLRN